LTNECAMGDLAAIARLSAVSWVMIAPSCGVDCRVHKRGVRCPFLRGSFRANHLRGSGRPGHVDPRLVAARDARHERLVQVRAEFRNRGGEVGDGVAERARHVEARLLGWRASPPRPAAQPRGSRELPEARLALRGSLRGARDAVVGFGPLQLVVQFAEPLSILPEGFAIELRTGIAHRKRLLALCGDERKGEHGLAWSRNKLAEMPEPLEVRHVDALAVELDVP